MIQNKPNHTKTLEKLAETTKLETCEEVLVTTCCTNNCLKPNTRYQNQSTTNPKYLNPS